MNPSKKKTIFLTIKYIFLKLKKIIVLLIEGENKNICHCTELNYKLLLIYILNV